MDEIINENLFKTLSLNDAKYMSILIFKDIQNYSCFEELTPDNMDGAGEFSPRFNWNILEFVPLKVHDLIQKLIFEYMLYI